MTPRRNEVDVVISRLDDRGHQSMKSAATHHVGRPEGTVGRVRVRVRDRGGTFGEDETGKLPVDPVLGFTDGNTLA